MPDFLLQTNFNNPALPAIPVYGFSDNFNRADGAIGVTSGEGKAWQKIGLPSTSTLTGVIVSNQVTSDAGTGAALYVVESLSANGVLTAKVGSVGTRQNGLGFRAQDANNYIRLAIRQNSTTFKYVLSKVVGGVSSGALATSTINSADGDIVRVTLSADQVSVTVNGVAAFAPVTVAEFTAQTRHGIWLNAGGTTALDDVSFVAA